MVLELALAFLVGWIIRMYHTCSELERELKEVKSKWSEAVFNENVLFTGINNALGSIESFRTYELSISVRQDIEKTEQILAQTLKAVI